MSTASDFTTKKRARSRTNDGANSTVTARVDRATNQCSAYSTDNEADRSIASAAMQPAVRAAPFGFPVSGRQW
jgi:hypothetical protein